MTVVGYDESGRALDNLAGPGRCGCGCAPGRVNSRRGMQGFAGARGMDGPGGAAGLAFGGGLLFFIATLAPVAMIVDMWWRGVKVRRAQ